MSEPDPVSDYWYALGISTGFERAAREVMAAAQGQFTLHEDGRARHLREIADMLNAKAKKARPEKKPS